MNVKRKELGIRGEQRRMRVTESQQKWGRKFRMELDYTRQSSMKLLLCQ